MNRTIVLLALLIAVAAGAPSLLDGDHSHDHSHDQSHDHSHDHHAHDHSHEHSHDHDQAHDHSHGPADSSSTAAPAAQAKSDSETKASEVNDGGRLLSLPEPDACSKRPKHWELNGRWYFVSTNVTDYKDLKMDWLDARNLCRKHCMDSVSLETSQENDLVVKVVQRDNLPYIWTSGRLCNFKGCDRPDLQPLSVNGWFWSGSGAKIAPTDKTPAGWDVQPWSATGHFKRPQPDNAEFEINQTTEACLGVLNNIYKDGIQWHDIGCYHKKAVICEDSPQLLQYIAATNPGIQL